MASKKSPKRPAATSGRWRLHHRCSDSGGANGGPLIETSAAHAPGMVRGGARARAPRPSTPRPTPPRRSGARPARGGGPVPSRGRCSPPRARTSGRARGPWCRGTAPGPGQERLEVREHERGVLHRAPVEPDHGRRRGVTGLPPVQAVTPSGASPQAGPSLFSNHLLAPLKLDGRGHGYSITTRTSPGFTAWPACTRISFTVPAARLELVLHLHGLENDQPVARPTACPTSTSTRTTRPGIGALSTWPPGPPCRRACG